MPLSKVAPAKDAKLLVLRMIFLPEQSSNVLLVVLPAAKVFPKSVSINWRPLILIHLPTSAVVRFVIVFSVATTAVAASLESKKVL